MSLIEKDPETGRFLPGNSGNGGRQRGARNLLGEAMLKDLYHDWLDHGLQAVVEMRETRPADYVKVVALLVSRCEDAIYDRIMHDEEIEALIEERRQKVIVQLERTRE